MLSFPLLPLLFFLPSFVPGKERGVLVLGGIEMLMLW